MTRIVVWMVTHINNCISFAIWQNNFLKIFYVGFPKKNSKSSLGCIKGCINKDLRINKMHLLGRFLTGIFYLYFNVFLCSRAIPAECLNRDKIKGALIWNGSTAVINFNLIGETRFKINKYVTLTCFSPVLYSI